MKPWGYPFWNHQDVSGNDWFEVDDAVAESALEEHLRRCNDPRAEKYLHAIGRRSVLAMRTEPPLGIPMFHHLYTGYTIIRYITAYSTQCYAAAVLVAAAPTAADKLSSVCFLLPCCRAAAAAAAAAFEKKSSRNLDMDKSQIRGRRTTTHDPGVEDR